MLKYITNFFTRLLAYSGDLTEGPFWCKFYLFAKWARACETWKLEVFPDRETNPEDFDKLEGYNPKRPRNTAPK